MEDRCSGLSGSLFPAPGNPDQAFVCNIQSRQVPAPDGAISRPQGICLPLNNSELSTMSETSLDTVAVAEPLIGPRLSPAGGVAIIGVDLCRPLLPAFRDAILAAFRDHHIVVFHDQDLSNEAQLAFTLQFG